MAQIQPVGIDFDFRSDSDGGDPDSKSRALQAMHCLLWSKKLPDGSEFNVVAGKRRGSLLGRIGRNEIAISSDCISHSFRATKKMKTIIKEIPIENLDSFQKLGSTIGAFIVFPSKRVQGKMTVNGARGFHNKIGDRFDLTLECIRLFYFKKKSPLTEVLSANSDFFNLFQDFKKYLEFFFLQDLYDEENSRIKYFLENDVLFKESPFPQDVRDYLSYRQNVMTFLIARNKRIENWLLTNGAIYRRDDSF